MRRRAYTLIEAIAASAVIAVALTGSISCLLFALNGTSDGHTLMIAGQIARGEVERAKIWGWSNLPLGTISATTPPTGTWSGAFDGTLNSGSGGWQQGSSTYYNSVGTQVTSSDATRIYVVLTTITDSGTNQVLDSASSTPSVGDAYTLDMYATREIVVVVTDAWTGKTDATYGTMLVRGGT